MNIATLTGMEPHPVIPLVPPAIIEQWDEPKRKEYAELRKETLILTLQDPFNHGWEPDIWKKADDEARKLRERHPKGVITELDLGGNRASKTERRAKRLVENLVKNPGWRAWALQSSQVSSRQNQQSIIYKYLPLEWRPESGKMRGGRVTKIVYSQAGGFTEDTLVCPNGSQLWFKFYTMDVKSVEGAELNEAWPDELVTPDWIEALTYRLVTRDGLLGITFTPLEGYSASVKKYLTGAVTIEEAMAELLPILNAKREVIGHENVPRVQHNEAEKAAILYFHTADNPFGNYDSMKATLEGKNRDEILMRAYGVPVKATATAFPKWKDVVHIITWARWEQILKDYPNGTRYHLVDPCSGRNWFMGWLYCWKPGHAILYREWPSYGHVGAYVQGVGADPGPWAVAGKAEDGDRGPAQSSFGMGLRAYKETIFALEKGEVIFDRWMDCRYGNAAKQEREGTTTLIEQMSDEGMDFVAMVGEKNILNARDGSLDMINDALEYDEDPQIPLGIHSPRLARLNEPRLLVVDTCPNTIFAMQNFTGRDGQHGACKDPVDILRGFYLSELDYVGKQSLQPISPWQRQFRKQQKV